MASNSIITDLVIQHLPLKRKSTPTGGWYINCPMCTQMGQPRNDTKFRCGITPQAGGGLIVHCYNCGYATKWEVNGRVSYNLMRFLTSLGISTKEVPIGLRLLRNDETYKYEIKKNVIDVVLDFDEKKLPSGAKTLEQWAESDEIPNLFLDAIKYLSDRGDAIFNGWTYYWTNKTILKLCLDQRIIIPFYHHGKIVGYTARCFTDNQSIPKYYGDTPANFLFNQEILENDYEHVFLVEGVFDAIAINGIATLGNKLSQKQINLLNSSKKEIILVPDRNKAGEELVEQAIENKWNISIPDWDRDINDCAAASNKYGKLYTLESIYDGIISDPVKARMFFGMARI